MIKIVMIGFFLSCFGQIFTQNRIFIKPIIENTAYLSHSKDKKIITTDFEYTLLPIVFGGGLDIGVTIGFVFNHGRSFIETGIQQSMAGSGIQYKCFVYNPSTSSIPYYYEGTGGYAMATSGIKIPFRFSAQLCKGKIYVYKPTSYYFRCNVVMGIHLYHQYTDTAALSIYEESVLISPFKKIEFATYSYTFDKSFALLIEGGLAFELGKNEKEWFTFSLNYLRGFSNLMVNKAKITVSDINNKQIYTANAYGQGTAFVLSLSKKIYLTKKRVLSK